MPSPTYSPTDVGAAAVVVLGFALDVLTGYGVLPAVDPATRVPLMSSLTLLAGAGLTALIANRRVKHQAVAAVETATVAAAPAAAVAAAPPAPPVPFAGGSFVITPASAVPPPPAPAAA